MASGQSPFLSLFHAFTLGSEILSSVTDARSNWQPSKYFCTDALRQGCSHVAAVFSFHTQRLRDLDRCVCPPKRDYSGRGTVGKLRGPW